MDVINLSEVISNMGVTVVILAYFIYRDLTVMKRIENILSVLEKLTSKEKLKEEE